MKDKDKELHGFYDPHEWDRWDWADTEPPADYPLFFEEAPNGWIIDADDPWVEPPEQLPEQK